MNKPCRVPDYAIYGTAICLSDGKEREGWIWGNLWAGKNILYQEGGCLESFKCYDVKSESIKKKEM